MTKGVVGTLGSYLPQTVTEMWEPQRDFAHIKVRRSGNTTAAAASRDVAVSSTGAGSLDDGTASTEPGSSGATSFGGSGLKSVVAMSNNSPQVMVVTSDGGFSVYNIDMESGGEGYLVKQLACV